MPLITKDWRDDLHAYLGGVVKGIDGVPLAVGGVEDQVHLLVGLRATHRLDYVLRDTKANSSNWVHTVVGQKKFEWQTGYLGLTVSPSQNRTSQEVCPQSGKASPSPEFPGRVPRTTKVERDRI
jgi:hypothetical protein